ncbi:multidrug DMT transporter permease [Halobacteriales archaeon QS_5_68_33]|nr:MAG: multidrug DMT transporter permease [Halobacteriales archaeon QS_5_68_33]
MTKWLRSGRRRDLSFILYDEGSLHGQALKSRLESHYGERIDPKSFYGALDALVDGGHLELQESGIHDEYLLTDAGRELLESHLAWVRERTGDGEGTGDGKPDGENSE